MRRETGRRGYQRHVMDRLRKEFPGCFIMKNDAGVIQGIPDLIVLYYCCWAMLETKRGVKAAKQPNQDYYVEALNSMSFAAFINPENEEEIFDELHRAFKSCRHPRFLKPQQASMAQLR